MKNSFSVHFRRHYIFIAVILLFSLQTGCDNQPTIDEKSIPLSDNAITELTKNTTLNFARAVNAGDLSLFREGTADEFKENFSVEQFNNAFGGFIQQKINMMAVQSQSPSFEQKPSFNGSGNLLAQGYFPTSPSRVWFNYTYKRDPIEWKIIGIDIKVIPQN